jgi:hypothetical protein
VTPLAHVGGLDRLARAQSRGPHGETVRRARATTTHEEHLVLVAPATLASCIAESGVTPPAGRALRVLIADVRMLDWLDDGQWYRLVGSMLGQPLTLELVATTVEPDRARRSVVHEALDSSAPIAARLEVGTADSLVAQVGTDAFDLAISFAPVAVRPGHDGADVPALVQLARDGVPTYVCDYATLPSLLTRRTAEAWGLQSTCVSARNPFRLVSRSGGEHWAGVIARLSPGAAPCRAPNGEARALLEAAARMVSDSHATGHAAQPYPVGSVTSERANGRPLVHACDGLLVDADGSLWRRSGGRTVSVGALPDAWLDVARGYVAEWKDTDRFLWAVLVKQGSLVGAVDDAA